MAKIEVIATQVGTYPAGVTRNVGERFELADEADFGQSWMAKAEDDVSVPRVRENIGTPARAETGPNAAIAAEYAEAGHSTTSLLLLLRDADTRAAAAEARAKEFEALYTAAVAGRANEDEGAARRNFDVSAAEAEANAKKAAGDRKEAVDHLNEAIKTAEDGLADPHRSEQPELQKPEVKEREEAVAEADKAREEAEAAEAAAENGEGGDEPTPTRTTRRARRG